MKIRKAETKDIEQIENLLSQVLEVHAAIRPDIFISGTRKYSREELESLISDPDTPVFAAADENDVMRGYAMCRIKHPDHSGNMQPILSLYVDDLCVDEAYRGHHIASDIFAYVKEYAKEKGCHNITLNVWEGNDGARAFYERCGFGIQKTTMEMIIKKA